MLREAEKQAREDEFNKARFKQAGRLIGELTRLSTDSLRMSNQDEIIPKPIKANRKYVTKKLNTNKQNTYVPRPVLRTDKPLLNRPTTNVLAQQNQNVAPRPTPTAHTTRKVKPRKSPLQPTRQKKPDRRPFSELVKLQVHTQATLPPSFLESLKRMLQNFIKILFPMKEI